MFENKKIFILGMARSGYEAAKVLIKRNNTIVINDMNDKEDVDKVKELESLGVKVVLGSHPEGLLDESFDYVIKNPGIHFDHKYVVYAVEHSIPVITEIEMAYHLLPSGVKLVGITGTNGKTTTTSLTYEIMKNYYGNRIHLAGNIGYPLSGILNDIKEDDIVVMEIGVPQLHDMYDTKFDVAVLTNIFEAHLDMFGTREFYNQNKLKIFNHQLSSDVAIVNKGNLDAYNLVQGINSTIKYFSSVNKIEGCYLLNDIIYYYDEMIVNVNNLKLQGIHNYENVMCAVMVAKEFNIPNENIINVLRDFKGVEHRIEFVREFDGKMFYNDSKATNIKATQIALGAFKKPVVLLLGGMERGQNYNDLKDYLGFTKLVVTYGECKDRIVEVMKSFKIPVVSVNNLKEATIYAEQNSVEGDIILLSPGAASWDQYKSFEIRGEEFKNIVKEF